MGIHYIWQSPEHHLRFLMRLCLRHSLRGLSPNRFVTCEPESVSPFDPRLAFYWVGTKWLGLFVSYSIPWNRQMWLVVGAPGRSQPQPWNIKKRPKKRTKNRQFERSPGKKCSYVTQHIMYPRSHNKTGTMSRKRNSISPFSEKLGQLNLRLVLVLIRLPKSEKRTETVIPRVKFLFLETARLERI